MKDWHWILPLGVFRLMVHGTQEVGGKVTECFQLFSVLYVQYSCIFITVSQGNNHEKVMGLLCNKGHEGNTTNQIGSQASPLFLLPLIFLSHEYWVFFLSRTLMFFFKHFNTFLCCCLTVNCHFCKTAALLFFIMFLWVYLAMQQPVIDVMILQKYWL